MNRIDQNIWYVNLLSAKLTRKHHGSYFVLQAFGEAWKLGWRVRVRCLLIGPHHKRGHRDGVR